MSNHDLDVLAVGAVGKEFLGEIRHVVVVRGYAKLKGAVKVGRLRQFVSYLERLRIEGCQFLESRDIRLTEEHRI